MTYYTTVAIVIPSAMLPAIIGSIRFKLLDKASRTFLFLIWFSFITECFAFVAAVSYKNNLPVYNVSNIIQIAVIVAYYTYCIELFRKHHIGLLIGTVSVLLGILNFIFLASIKSADSNIFLYQTILVFVMTGIYFSQLTYPNFLKVRFYPQFWFMISLLAFYVLSFFVLSLYGYFSEILHHRKSNADVVNLCIGVVTNIGFAVVFLCYPLMKRRNVR